MKKIEPIPAARTSLRRTNPRARLLTAAVAATAVCLLPSATAPVAAAPSQDKTLQQLQRERDAVRQKKAAQASEVNALEATDAQVSAALSTLNSNVNAQQDRVEEAERAVSQANADKAAAEKAQAEKQAELDQIVGQMKTSAVEAYVSMGSNDSYTTIGTGDINDTVNKRTLLAVKANENVDLTERFRSVQEDLELQRAAAAEAEERATKQQAAVEDRLDELNEAYAQQQAFAAQVEQRIESALAEADSLAAIDAKLSSSINSKQAEIAKAVAAQRAAEKARATQRAAQNKQSISSGGGGGNSGGGGGGGGSTPPIVGNSEIVTVGGIRVHRSIAGNLQSLLAAASASGINFGGGGYRDSAGQIATRRNNCGSSHYAIYEMPASSCRPPTARPGSSMHERGLAIDFTQGGSTLTRGSSGFAWLRANAASYGFFNLPSEPWHWSTNGN